jgi:hypothetical protein
MGRAHWAAIGNGRLEISDALASPRGCGAIQGEASAQGVHAGGRGCRGSAHGRTRASSRPPMGDKMSDVRAFSLFRGERPITEFAALADQSEALRCGSQCRMLTLAAGRRSPTLGLGCGGRDLRKEE